MLLRRLTEQESPRQVQGAEGIFFAKVLAQVKAHFSP